jgi:hypothetical protein
MRANGIHLKRLDNLGFLLLVLVLQSCGVAQIPYQGLCGRTPNLELVSLAMVPDPLPEARKIDQWRAIIRSDSSDLCMTTLGVIEADTDKLVTPEIRSELSLGANEVTLSSLENYRLSGKEICFEVSAYMDGNKISLTSPRRFCARTIDRGWWSMR